VCVFIYLFVYIDLFRMAAGGVAGGVLTAVDDDAVACEYEDDDGGHGDDEHAFDNISNIKNHVHLHD